MDEALKVVGLSIFAGGVGASAIIAVISLVAYINKHLEGMRGLQPRIEELEKQVSELNKELEKTKVETLDKDSQEAYGKPDHT